MVSRDVWDMIRFVDMVRQLSEVFPVFFLEA